MISKPFFLTLRKLTIPIVAVILLWSWALSGQMSLSLDAAEPLHAAVTSTIVKAPQSSRILSPLPAQASVQHGDLHQMPRPQPLNASPVSSSLVHVSGVLTIPPKACNEKLYTPTFVSYIEPMDAHVIVDCWHHRVLFASNKGGGYDPLGPVELPIHQWADLTNISFVAATSDMGDTQAQVQRARTSLGGLNIPHSVATDGNILVTESSVGGSNGDNHSVLVFRMHKPISQSDPPRLEFLDEVLGCDGNRARRPHRIIYDSNSRSFFLYMTSPAFLARFVWNDGLQKLERTSCQTLPFMKGMYARSIVAHSGSLYITAGPGVIWRTELDASSGLVVKKQAFPIKHLGFVKGKMNDLAFFDGWWYATSTVPCAMVRFRNINRLWEHEKLHSQLGLCKPFSRRERRCLGGTPYFVSKVGDRIFVPYIFGCSGVVSFRAIDGGGIADVQQHWGGGWVEDDGDLQCRGTLW